LGASTETANFWLLNASGEQTGKQHGQLGTHPGASLAAYDITRRLKTPGGLAPYEYICKIWTSEPDRFILNPIRQMPELNT